MSFHSQYEKNNKHTLRYSLPKFKLRLKIRSEVGLILTSLIAMFFFSACDKFGTDKQKSSETTLAEVVKPGVPAEFSTEVIDGNVQLSWVSTSPELKYNLYMASESGVTPDTIGILKNGVAHRNVNSPFNIPGLEEGTAYYFVLTAQNDKEESDPTNEISATPVTIVAEPEIPLPNTPVNLQAIPADNEITLTWDSSDNAEQYNLYMATEFGINPKLYSRLHNGMAHLNVSSPYTVYGLNNNEVHYFVIAAKNETGESPVSQEIFATPQSPDRPAAPTRFKVTPDDGQITLSWNKVPGVEQYNAYVATQSGVDASTYSRLPGSVNLRNISSPYTLKGLTNGISYYFVLTSQSEAGESETTQEFMSTPHQPKLVAPRKIDLIAADEQITVSWKNTKNTERYNLYIATQKGVTPENYSVLSDGDLIEDISSPYVIKNLKNNAQYYIAMTSIIGDRESGVSTYKIGEPKKPYIPPPPRSKTSMQQFITLSSVGRPLKNQANPYEKTPWSCVKSESTGLIWEVKTNKAGLQNKNNTYTWYVPIDANGGNPGKSNGGQCKGSQCDTNDYIKSINKKRLCNYTDWRLPTREELLTLLNSEAKYPNPTIDTDAFPNTINSYHWSSSTYDVNPQLAWFAYFGSGYDYYEYKTIPNYVRLVRGGQ